MTAQPYPFDHLSLADIAEYPRLWATIYEALPHLNEQDAAIVVSLVVDACHGCRDNNRQCRCWNDE